MLDVNNPTMMTIIVDGRVHILRVTPVKQTTAEEVVAELQKSKTIDSGLMPAGTRFLRRTENRAKFVVERPPRRLIARFQPVLGPTISRLAVPIWLPWQIYSFSVSGNTVTDSRFFWAKRSIQSVDDELLRYTLPNMWDENRPCYGALPTLPESPEATIEYLISHIMASAFNNDLAQYLKNIPTIISGQVPTRRIGNVDVPHEEMHASVEHVLKMHAWGEAHREPERAVNSIPWQPVGRVSDLLK